ncbi:hypothetical protein TSMEX_010054 [Taenia solium]|eukprot:TsM_001210000 transcript=TsM_001210000 gene=TsM_001210000
MPDQVHKKVIQPLLTPLIYSTQSHLSLDYLLFLLAFALNLVSAAMAPDGEVACKLKVDLFEAPTSLEDGKLTEKKEADVEEEEDLAEEFSGSIRRRDCYYRPDGVVSDRGSVVRFEGSVMVFEEPLEDLESLFTHMSKRC